MTPFNKANWLSPLLFQPLCRSCLKVDCVGGKEYVVFPLISFHWNQSFVFNSNHCRPLYYHPFHPAAQMHGTTNHLTHLPHCGEFWWAAVIATHFILLHILSFTLLWSHHLLASFHTFLIWCWSKLYWISKVHLEIMLILMTFYVRGPKHFLSVKPFTYSKKCGIKSNKGLFIEHINNCSFPTYFTSVLSKKYINFKQ